MKDLEEAAILLALAFPIIINSYFPFMDFLLNGLINLIYFLIYPPMIPENLRPLASFIYLLILILILVNESII